MSDEELLSHPEFQALCARWQADGRAPLPGADWFTERGMYGEAGGWEWAATEPERGGLKWGGLAEGEGFIAPKRWEDETKWAWYCGRTGRLVDREDLPNNMENEFLWKSLPTFPAAILWFLKRSAEVYGPDGPPRTVTHEAVAT